MKKVYYVVAALIIFISACKKEASVNEAQPQNTPGKVITYHLKNGGQVTAQINNRGEYVVGGDVILSKDQIAYLEYNKIGGDKTTTPRSTFTAEFQKLWPGGIVYYVINDATHSSDILNAISDWEASTPIRFVQRTNQANFVNFQGAPQNGGGDSQLGMVGGQQFIRLSSGADKSTVIHEIGHAVGLMHEQTRADRDQYININFSNINSTWSSQYATYNVLGISGFQIGTFDFNSIMLYRSYAAEASINGNTSPQMTKKDGSTWGDNYYLSQGDIDGVNYLYSPSVYARISVVYDDVNSYSNIDDARHIYINKAEFFSDASYTTKVVLQKPIELKYIYTHEEIGRTTEINESWTVIAPTGANEVYLGESRDEYRLDYGNYVFHFISSYQIKNGVGYKL